MNPSNAQTSTPILKQVAVPSLGSLEGPPCLLFGVSEFMNPYDAQTSTQMLKQLAVPSLGPNQMMWNL